jgi:hypothetical protein
MVQLSHSSRPAAIASAGASKPTPAKAVASAPRRQGRAIVVSIGILALMTAGAAVAVTIEVQRSAAPPVAASASQRNEFDGGAARITNDLNGKCSTGAFDNKTGRITQSDQPCEEIPRDSNGVPIPVGTIHRLDSISKAFSGR